MKIKKIILLFLFLFASSFFNSPAALAQNVQTVYTQVGEAGGAGNEGVVRWAQTITSGLGRLGSDCLFNVQQKKICSDSNTCAAVLPGDCNGYYPGYLCTQLVRDSYNLAGFNNSFSLNTYYQFEQWSNRSGFSTSQQNNRETILRLKPGDPIFMFVDFKPDGLKHVVIIKSINVDNNGSGEIKILQSNSGSVTNTYPVRNWKVVHYYREDPNSLMYFGFAPVK